MCDEIYNLDDGAFFACEEAEEVWTEIVKDEKPVRKSFIFRTRMCRVVRRVRRVPIPRVRCYWQPQQARAPPV